MPIRIKPLPKSDPLKKSPAQPGGILVALYELAQLYGLFSLRGAVGPGSGRILAVAGVFRPLNSNVDWNIKP
jgi:hypothetical protein